MSYIYNAIYNMYIKMNTYLINLYGGPLNQLNLQKVFVGLMKCS